MADSPKDLPDSQSQAQQKTQVSDSTTAKTQIVDSTTAKTQIADSTTAKTQVVDSTTAKTQLAGTPASQTQVSDASAAETRVSSDRTTVQRPSSPAGSGGSTVLLGGETTVVVGEGQVASVAASPEVEEEASDDLEVGDVLKDRFVIEKIIGRGGMGVVYKARDLRKEETEDRDPFVAVKVLGEAFRRDPRMVVALQREARKAQSLAHPAIATVYDFDREGDRVYLTMEVLKGLPVDEVVNEHPDGMEHAKALEVVRGMCLGLAYAHNKNIIHSDFKPGNVFLTGDNRTKILDFGIARAAPAGTFGSANLQKYNRSALASPEGGDASSKSGGNETVFDAGSLGALTPAYASCEMFEGKEPHPADDVYALALTHYELLTGKHPFGNAPAPAARDAGMVPAPIPGLHRRHWKAIQKGLAFAREDRSQHAAEYLGDLDGKTRTKLALAATAVLLVATGSYLAMDQARQIEVAKPDVPFAELAQSTQDKFSDWISFGDVALSFDPPIFRDAFESYLFAYDLHPRNALAVARLESLIEPYLEAARAEPDPSIRNTLRENIVALAERDDFMRQNAVLRKALKDLENL